MIPPFSVCHLPGVIWLLALSIGANPAWPTAEDCNSPTTLKPFPVEHAIGAKWNAATRSLVYGIPRKDGHYATFLSDADGGHDQRVVFSGWRDDRHQFPAAWHPSGRFLAPRSGVSPLHVYMNRPIIASRAGS